MKLDQIRDGEWVTPFRRGYVLGCCRCGLRHRVDFRVAKGTLQFRAVRLRTKKKAAVQVRCSRAGGN